NEKKIITKIIDFLKDEDQQEKFFVLRPGQCG
ncbi:hypothetical protein DBR06_SOUSAS10610013, partial [Sousa chinensis]